MEIFYGFLFLFLLSFFYWQRLISTLQQRLTMCAQRNNIIVLALVASLSLGSYGVSSRWLVGVVALRLGPGVVGVVCAPDNDERQREEGSLTSLHAWRALRRALPFFRANSPIIFFLQF